MLQLVRRLVEDELAASACAWPGDPEDAQELSRRRLDLVGVAVIYGLHEGLAKQLEQVAGRSEREEGVVVVLRLAEQVVAEEGEGGTRAGVRNDDVDELVREEVEWAGAVRWRRRRGVGGAGRLRGPTHGGSSLGTRAGLEARTEGRREAVLGYEDVSILVLRAASSTEPP